MSIESIALVVILLMFQGSCFLFFHFKFYEKYCKALIAKKDQQDYSKRIVDIINFSQSENYGRVLLDAVNNKSVILYGFNYACKAIVEQIANEANICMIVENDEANFPQDGLYKSIPVIAEKDLPLIEDNIIIVCIINNRFTMIADEIRRKFPGNNIICLPHLIKELTK